MLHDREWYGTAARPFSTIGRQRGPRRQSPTCQRCSMFGAIGKFLLFRVLGARVMLALDVARDRSPPARRTTEGRGAAVSDGRRSLGLPALPGLVADRASGPAVAAPALLEIRLPALAPAMRAERMKRDQAVSRIRVAMSAWSRPREPSRTAGQRCDVRMRLRQHRAIRNGFWTLDVGILRESVTECDSLEG